MWESVYLAATCVLLLHSGVSGVTGVILKPPVFSERKGQTPLCTAVVTDSAAHGVNRFQMKLLSTR